MSQFSQQPVLKKFLRSLMVLAAAFFIVFASFQNSYAALDVGVGRIRSCGTDGVPSGLEFFTATSDRPVADPGDDLDIVLSNPVCLAFFLDSYVVIKTTISLMNKACGSGSAIPRVYPSPLQDAFDIARASLKVPVSLGCAAAFTASVAAYGGLTATLYGIYGIADSAYKRTEVCGATWEAANPLTSDISSPNKKQKVKEAVEGYIRKGEKQKLALEDPANVTYREWYYGGEEVLDNPQGGHDPCYDVVRDKNSSGKYPPQRYYMRGLAAGNFNCKRYDLAPGSLDPQSNETITKSRVSEFQQAYKCCKNRSANYICLNYNSRGGALGANNVINDGTEAGAGVINDGTEAGVGVINDGTEAIGGVEVINDGTQAVGDGRFLDDTPANQGKVFCKAGTLCNIGGDINGVTFSTKSIENGSLVCAETYSLCPYNFSVGGGTEYCDYYQDGKWDSRAGRWVMISPEDIAANNCATKSEIRNPDCSYNTKANKCKNYCQYLTHCTTTASLQDYQYQSNLGSPYFSDACKNFVGDSQNQTSYGGGFILNSQKHFSAPIAQCVRETMENVFYNVAGHSECNNPNEYPSLDGTCPSGSYAAIQGSEFPYKKGGKVKEISFFTMVQETLQNAVKLTLTLSIMFYGMNILIGKANIGDKKDILMYLLKIALVLYFATGDAWQSMFFKGVYGASSEFSQMVFKFDVGDSELKRDGCQFGMITNSDGEEVSSGRLYPKGKEYLALWDTLDCKMMRYLGYGPEMKVANIASLIMASFLSSYLGGFAIYFAVAVMFFGFCFVALTVRALHIFLASSMAIIIMVFVSPIMITLSLFARTAEMFKSWTKQLIGFCLQPMILFAYVAFFITVMDKVLIGSATFSGQAPSKAIDCSKICKDSNGVVKPYNANNELDDCDQKGDKIINPMNDSVACLISLDDFGKMPGLEMFGLTIPILMNIFSDNLQLKILTILKGAIVMILLYKFMDEIPGIATKLVGGDALGVGNSNARKMMNQFGSIAQSITKRGVGGLKKVGQKGMEKAGQAREAVRSAGSKGKSTDSAKDSAKDSPKDSSGEKDGGGDH